MALAASLTDSAGFVPVLDGHGWIGAWSPGIGDPTLLGWVTVGLYFVGAGYCWRTARGLQARGERRIFSGLALGLLLLGINKQLDLQSAFTEVGRIWAQRQGWYEQRGELQRAFIVQVALFGLLGLGALAWLTRRAPLPTRAALAGSVLLVAFVVVRAASFHHVDLFLGSGWLGVRANWVLEMGGILAIVAAARWRSRFSARPSPKPARAR